jgi:hypothetical protein
VTGIVVIRICDRTERDDEVRAERPAGHTTEAERVRDVLDVVGHQNDLRSPDRDGGRGQ